MSENVPLNKPIVVDEIEGIVNGNDPYTWIDQITNNVMKIIRFLWLYDR